MEIKEGVVYKFETTNCPVCKIIDGHLTKSKVSRNIQIERCNLSNDEDTLLFLQEVTDERSMPILLYRKKNEIKTLSGLHSDKEVDDFLKAFIK